MTGRRVRTLASLVGILLALTAGFLFLAKKGREPEEGQPSLLPLTADRIAEIRWSFADGRKLEFARKDGVWVSANDAGTDNGTGTVSVSGAAVNSAETVSSAETAGSAERENDTNTVREAELDQKKVSRLAASVTGIGVTSVIKGEDPSAYGLEEPASVLTVTDTDGKAAEIQIGMQNEMTQDVYCMLNGDRETVYAVKPSILDLADLSMEDYIKKK